MIKNKVIIRNLGVATALVFVTTTAFSGCSSNGEKKGEENLEGIQLLTQMEKENVAELESKIDKHLGGTEDLDESEKDEKVKDKENNRQASEVDEIKADKATEKEETTEEDMYDKEYNEIFSDTIFMGDSITEGLYYMEVIDKSKVIASMGATILTAKDEFSKVSSLAPKNIMLLYGMNDVILFDGANEWVTIDGFKANYKEFLQSLKNQLPKTEIYVQSPLSVADGDLQSNPRLTNDNLDELRIAVAEVCEEVGVNYVDINSILEKDKTLWIEDGIHLKYDFYIRWMNLLEKEMKN